MSDITLLDMILEPGGIGILFQPIVEIIDDKKTIHSLECLARGPVGTNAEMPSVLFDYVRRKNEEVIVDQTCLTAAIRVIKDLSLPYDFSLNLHTRTLKEMPNFHSWFVEQIKRADISPNRLILELTAINDANIDSDELKENIERLRNAGVRIALDDFGVKQSNFMLIMELQPHLLWLDRQIVMGCGEDPKKLFVIETLQTFVNKIGACLIAKGVEEEADYQALREIGVNIMQGFLFAPPLAGDLLLETSYLQDCLV
ncbi:MAG: EAL domain-containing protein [Blastocatellia bacterium]|nr:EAL domain-containing protein [Blastocatellia bacterium]